ncbi:MAG: aromatic amino acid ammonia-lyase [Clostridium sp.]|nr:aromatic amino acid ammonia-lyase [Clostridium sp.]
MGRIVLDGINLSIEDVVNAARNHYEVAIDEQCMNKIATVREYMEREWMRDDAPAVYGFNTGLGKHKDHKVPLEESIDHQYRTVLSHCGGVGEPAPIEVVRAAMTVRLNAFCRGVSGLRPVVVNRLLSMLNADVVPVVPWQGSVGACGDLAPMAHIVSVLVGVPQAEAFFKGERMPAREALKAAGLEETFELHAKDALALLNGTTLFAGMACLNVYDAERLYKISEITTALSLEAMRGETRAFDPRIQEVRPYDGQKKAAANVLRVVEGSTRVTEDCRKVHSDYDIMHPVYQERVQDVYSLRCFPQVQGICRENLTYIKHLINVEINAATDNPLIFKKNDSDHMEFLSGGNFHGEPTGFAMDLLTMSIAEIGNIADRRCFTLCDPTLSYGLPLALAGEPIGLNYGYNIICCSVSALASENKTLCFPAVCDNIPTKASQEDHVSMAPWATRKCKLAIKNLEKILGIELLLASRGIWLSKDLLKDFHLGKGSQAAYDMVTERINFTVEDQYMGNQSKATIDLVESGKLLKAVEDAIGTL